MSKEISNRETGRKKPPVRIKPERQDGQQNDNNGSKQAVEKIGDLRKSANSSQSESKQGIRYDADKLARYDLIPPEALDALATYYGQLGGPVQGPAVYPERNWEHGMAWCRCFASLMRHGWKWLRGENFDPKTGAHHMIAVAWNAFALYTYFCRNIGGDNRPIGVVPVDNGGGER